MAGKNKSSIWRQAQRNSVAIISLLVALSTLSYSTWRNEKSEDNRNHRQAAFEVLLKLNELQQVIFHRHYDLDENDKGNPRLGWTIVLTISDLSQLLPPPQPERAGELKVVWGDNWQRRGKEQPGVDTVLDNIDLMRDEILLRLHSIE